MSINFFRDFNNRFFTIKKQAHTPVILSIVEQTIESQREAIKVFLKGVWGKLFVHKKFPPVSSVSDISEKRRVLMKKFVFTLERLKEYREQTLDTEKGTLAELRAELRELEAELEKILEDIVRLNRELMELYEKGTTANDIAVHKRYINNKQQDLHMKRHQILMQNRKIEQQLEAVIDATKEVSKLEKLEEHQLDDYKAAEQKETEMFIEEFVSNADWRKTHAE